MAMTVKPERGGLSCRVDGGEGKLGYWNGTYAVTEFRAALGDTVVEAYRSYSLKSADELIALLEIEEKHGEVQKCEGIPVPDLILNFFYWETLGRGMDWLLTAEGKQWHRATSSHGILV
jgi:hypothetical protein